MANIDIESGRYRDPDRLDGMPSLAAFICEDPDTAIFRKFSRLGARNLLHLQSHLNELESKLETIDRQQAHLGDPNDRQNAKSYDRLRSFAKQYTPPEGGNANTGSNPVAGSQHAVLTQAYEQLQLHREISATLHEYRQALLEENQIQKLPNPSRKAFAAFKKYFRTKKDGPVLVGHDKKVIADPKDVIALIPPTDDDRLSALLRYTCGYCLKERKRKLPNPHPEIFFFPHRRLQILSNTISSLLCGILLVGAMSCLGILNNRSWKLRIGLVSFFTAVFASFVALLTNAKRSEVFGATAAYAAVLVVFVSANFGPSGAKTAINGLHNDAAPWNMTSPLE